MRVRTDDYDRLLTRDRFKVLRQRREVDYRRVIRRDLARKPATTPTAIAQRVLGQIGG